MLWNNLNTQTRIVLHNCKVPIVIEIPYKADFIMTRVYAYHKA